MCKNFIT